MMANFRRISLQAGMASVTITFNGVGLFKAAAGQERASLAWGVAGRHLVDAGLET
jgi:hypothetical protein